MKLKLIFIGKTDEAWLKEAIDKYLGRVRNYISVELVVIQDIKNIGKKGIDFQKEEEGRQILRNIGQAEEVFLLDENGKEFSSEDFSVFLQKKMNAGLKVLTLVIGGAFGFSNEVYTQVPNRLSLSKMTFSHQMVRLLLVEQLYRAFSILNNEPYHHR